MPRQERVAKDEKYMIKDIMEANEAVAPGQREIAVLREYFPACFRRDGSFDLSRFQEYLSDKVAVAHEGYELRFLGKNYARLLSSLDTTTVVVPDQAHNALPENAQSRNVYISGDNLDALKHLLKSYARKVQCIYIDPPYNTGTDGFVYKDHFEYTPEELAEKLSVSDDQARRILDLARRGSASHSAWLMFMYPRLRLARDLLSEEGVIFISIDDNEESNLRLICDDIFGEENFISSLTWEKKKKGSYLANAITNIKEYILVYARQKERFSGLIGEINSEEETYPCVNAGNGRDIRTIPAGIASKYREKDYTLPKGHVISDTTMSLVLHSDLVIQDGILAKDLVLEGNWRYGQQAMSEFAANGELYITRDLYLRRIVSKPRYKGLKDLLLRVGDASQPGDYDFDLNRLQDSGWGSNEDADEEQRLLFGEQSLMSYPKPVLLIMKLIAALQRDNFVVCDFFSGSATTAEAVMRLNSRGKNLRYILVQLPEDLDEKAAISTGDDKKSVERLIAFLDSCGRPHTLDQLGLERIQRAAAKIREEHPERALDLGFSHFTLKEPSAVALDKIERFSPEENGLFDDTLMNEFGAPTVLATYLVRDGYGFSAPVQVMDFAGYTGYFMDKHLYLLNPGLSKEALSALMDRLETDADFHPEHLVLFGYSFAWTELEMLKVNLARLKDGGKNLRLHFDVRY